MNKLEQEFETWWEREGQEFLFALNTTTDDDIKLVAEVAWKNGAYCAEQADQEPVAYAPIITFLDQQHYSVSKQKKPEYCNPLYAAPVRTKNLTDDEIREIVKQVKFDGMTDKTFQFARAVIAAYKEKNK